MIVGALDSLGVALAKHGHKWSVGERTIYEEAIKVIASSQCRKAADSADLTTCAVLQPEEIQNIGIAIKAMHGCDSKYIESVPVHEVFQGETAWKGAVEVFALIGHAKAERAYAWQYQDGGKTKTVAVLKIPPVDSAQSAVKAAIAAKARQS